MQTFLVGGAVRDELLGILPNDLDWVVVGSTPEEMIRRGFTQVGADFPVFLDPESGDEHALARTERKTGKGYTGFVTEFGTDITLEEDLRRRDLTINSMAKDDSGNIIDPFGGQQDLKDQVLRHTSEAFAEDPLRVLRVARQAAKLNGRGFVIADDTIKLMKKMVMDGEVDHLVPERVLAELEKTIKHGNVRTFFGVLHDCGAVAAIFGDFVINANTLSLMCRIRMMTKGERPDLEIAGLFPFVRIGTKRIIKIAKHTKVSAHIRDVVRLVSAEHTLCMDHDIMEPKEVLRSMRSIDVFRRMEDRVEDFLLVCEAFLIANTLYSEDGVRNNIDRLRTKIEAVRGVDIQDLIDAGITGKDMQQAIEKRHIDILSESRTMNVLSRMHCTPPQ